ncbi:MAG: hypothetical protein ACKPBT_03895, partial [Microcystis aeruginosa]
YRQINLLIFIYIVSHHFSFQETGDRSQDSGVRRLFFIYSPHFPTTPHPTPHTPHPTPHFPVPFKQDLVLLLKSSFLLTD